MRGGTVTRRLLVCVAILVLALEHGLAAAATHLPPHPAPALMAVADSVAAPQECGAEPDGDGHGHGHGHSGTSCEIVVSGGTFHQPALAAGSVAFTGRPCAATVPHGCPVLSRSPPPPSLAALSVLRV